ncbi:MAG: ATP-binding cassette domain-containing protein [Dysgonamonadaceae bacterium]|jgi:cell division transport system ATP-binding protein|nr:ATP-binding cassette domain-containing protein [Dysgonamonadaceae bacterium]
MNEVLIYYKDVELCRRDNIILQNVTFTHHRGEFLYIMGKVGAGKSTLLKTLYAEMPVEKGEAMIFDYNLRKMKEKNIPLLRRKVGIVFQDFRLLSDRSVYKNLEFVLRATGRKNKNEIESRINEVLDKVGMIKKGYKYPYELSGGEQQRIAIARALLNYPEVILADEPTGNLDVESGCKIVQLLHDISKEGTAVIMSTHNHHLVNEFPAKVKQCKDGVFSDCDN